MKGEAGSSTYGFYAMAFKRFVLSSLMAAFSLMAVSLAARADSLPMVGFGDSLMAGYGLNPGEGFPEKLQAALVARGHDVVITNAGVSGDTTSGGLARLDWSVPDGTRVVILELGANDMLRGVSPTIVEKNLDAMITRLKERGMVVVLAGMLSAPNMGEGYKAAFDAIYPRLAEKHGLTLYPFFLDGVAGDGSLIQEDGLHPTAAGIDKMVERFLPTMEKVLASLPVAG